MQHKTFRRQRPLLHMLTHRHPLLVTVTVIDRTKDILGI